MARPSASVSLDAPDSDPTVHPESPLIKSYYTVCCTWRDKSGHLKLFHSTTFYAAQNTVGEVSKKKNTVGARMRWLYLAYELSIAFLFSIGTIFINKINIVQNYISKR